MKFDFTGKIKKIEDILCSFLPEVAENQWKNEMFSVLPAGVAQEHFNQLVEPCKKLVNLGGKRWRPLFMVLCSELVFDGECELAYNLTPVVEMVHTASLIHDDIEDGADMRRGEPCAHIVFGLDRSINAASWLYFSAFSSINSNAKDLKLKNDLNELLAVQLRRLHLGQAMDIFWHRNPGVIPTHEQYSAMVRMKTGTLANLAAQTGFLCAGGSGEGAFELGELSSKIGEGFQVVDDIINITTGNKGKKRGDDIVEGKKSLPLIFHLQEKPQDEKFILENFEKAAREGIESPAIEDTISILNTSDCIEKSRVYADKLVKDSCKKIIELYNGKEAAYEIEQLFVSMLK